MRALFLALFLAGGCADPYADAEKIGTIEAWEAFLAAEPSETQRMKAETKLEELMAERATTSKTVADFDTFLKRFPKSRKVKEMKAARADAAFAAAEADGTADAWKKFVDENPDADGSMQKRARGYVSVAEYGKLTLSEPVVAQVNLANDPKGPLDGWGFTVEVKNEGDKAVEYLNLELVFLDAAGKKLAAKSYPVVAQTGPGGMPIEEIYTKPLEPGQARTWNYTTGEAPEGWDKKVRVVASSVRFLGAVAEAPAAQ